MRISIRGFARPLRPAQTRTSRSVSSRSISRASLTLGAADSYGYDGDGNQTSFTDGRGIVTSTSLMVLSPAARDAVRLAGENPPVNLVLLQGQALVAQADVERAHYYPEDRDYLLELEPTVTHYEVLEQ